MSEEKTTPATASTGPKAKKSVALSGVVAGNTALCTVGRSGNDLHYRGYDILDIAEKCDFEEVAHLLIHGKLPNRAELKGYKAKLKRLRGLPVTVRAALEQLPPSSHPMDVMRTGVSALGCALPAQDARGRKRMTTTPPAPATSRTSWWRPSVPCSATGTTGATTASASRWRRTTTPWAATSCTCCTARSPRMPGYAPCTPRSSSTRSTSSTPPPSPPA